VGTLCEVCMRRMQAMCPVGCLWVVGDRARDKAEGVRRAL
jgi:hypothetical protein